MQRILSIVLADRHVKPDTNKHKGTIVRMHCITLHAKAFALVIHHADMSLCSCHLSRDCILKVDICITLQQ